MKNEESEYVALNIEAYSKMELEYYDSQGFFSRENQERIENIIKEIKQKGNGKIGLDVGCGSGNVYKFIEKYFDIAIGMDITLNMIKNKWIKEKGIMPPYLIKGDCNNLSMKNNTVDLISAYEVIHHLPHPEVFFKEAYGALKNGGVLYVDGEKNKKALIIFVTLKRIESFFNRKHRDYWRNYFKPKSNGEYHYGGFYSKWLHTSLKDAGFTDIKVNYVLTLNPEVKKKLFYKIIKTIKMESLYSHLQVFAKKNNIASSRVK